MPVPDTLRCEFVWTLGAIDWAVNVLHFTTGVGVDLTQSDVDAMATSIGADFTASTVRSLYPSTVSLARIRVRDLRTDGNEVLSGAIALPGTAVGDLLPVQTCVCTTLRTSLHSRSGRGRVYWPAPAETANASNGTVSTGTANAFQTFTQNLFLVPCGALGDVVLSVYSRTDNIARTVTARSTNTTWDVQTRRRDLAI